MEVLQLAIYFGGLVTFSVALMAYLVTKSVWVAPLIVVPMFYFVSTYALENRTNILLIGGAYGILSFIISWVIKVLLNKDRQHETK